MNFLRHCYIQKICHAVIPATGYSNLSKICNVHKMFIKYNLSNCFGKVLYSDVASCRTDSCLIIIFFFQ